MAKRVAPPVPVRCPHCQGTDTRALWSRGLANGARRCYRQCRRCGTTMWYEEREG